MSSTVYNRQRASPPRTNKSPPRSKGSQRRLPNNSRYDQYSGAGSTNSSEEYNEPTSYEHAPEGNCSQMIEDLQTLQDKMVDKYREKITKKCTERENDELLTIKANLVKLKEDSIDDYVDQWNEQVEKRRALCGKLALLSKTEEDLKKLVEQGMSATGKDAKTDQTQISKRQDELTCLRKEVRDLKSKVDEKERQLTDQEPNLTPKNSGSACCIM